MDLLLNKCSNHSEVCLCYKVKSHHQSTVNYKDKVISKFTVWLPQLCDFFSGQDTKNVAVLAVRVEFAKLLTPTKFLPSHGISTSL